MKFTEFTIQNFKGIKEETKVQLQPNRPICLIGLNESGKTTILEAIDMIGRMLKTVSHDDEEKGGISKDKLILMLPRSINTLDDVEIRFTCTLNLESDMKKIIDKLYSRNETEQTDDESDDEKSVEEELSETFKKLLRDTKGDLKIVFEFPFVGRNPVLEDALVMPKISIEGLPEIIQIHEKKLLKCLALLSPDIIYLPDFIFTVPDVIRVSTPSDEKDDEYYNRKENIEWIKILDDVSKGAIFNESLSKIPEKDRTDKRKQQLLIAANRFTFMSYIAREDINITNKDNALQAVTNYLNTMFINDWNEGIGANYRINNCTITQVQNRPFDYKIQLYTATDRFSFTERSKGCNWYFTFLLMTNVRSYRKTNSAVFLIDEPGNNLHPSMQRKVFSELQELAQRNFVVYSTHVMDLIPKNTEDCFYTSSDSDSSEKSQNVTIRNYESELQNNEESPAIETTNKKLFMEEIEEKAKKNPEIKNIWWGNMKSKLTLVGCSKVIDEIIEFVQKNTPLS